MTVVPNVKSLERLRAPFPAQEIGKLPRSTCKACKEARFRACDRHTWVNRCSECGNNHSSATMHIDYVGHADVTARLLEVDPHWVWEPAATTPEGLPLFDRTGGLWIRLTVLGVTRLGYGDVTGTGGPKEAIGDALRNAAMRFGVALDLWAKGDREWAHIGKDDATEAHPDQAAPRETAAPRQWTGPTTAELLAQIDADAAAAGVTYTQATAKMLSDLDVDGINGLDRLDPWVVAPYAEQIRAYSAKLVAERAAVEAASLVAAEAAARADQTPATTDRPLPEGAGVANWDTPS